jgi:hypothetical protein
MVHVQDRGGACNVSTGRCGIDRALSGGDVVIRTRGHQPFVARTDEHGVAHFRVPPDRYRVTLTEQSAYGCSAGVDPRPFITRTIRSQRLTVAQLVCAQM